MSSLKIASMNVQGLGDMSKRRDVLNYLKTKNFNIYCIQDTHFIDKESPYIRSIWGFNCYFSNFNSQSRGVSILINNNFDFHFKSLTKDETGNFLILDFTSYDTDLTLVCLYGPNKDSPEFYHNICSKIQHKENACFICGDFNLVLNPDIDCLNYVNVNNPKARDKVINMIFDLDLIDVWREDHLEEKKYTWLKKNPIKRARLDFFLISSSLYAQVDKSEILPGYRTDHSLITISLTMNQCSKGKSYWKFNNSLLTDIEYVRSIKEVIQRVKIQYASDSQPSNKPCNQCTNEEILFNIQDRLFFETLLLEIRGQTISYATFKKRQESDQQKALETEVQQLENADNINVDLLEEKKQELQQLRNKKLNGKLIRSRAKWIQEGEKPTQYFCNLENRNFVSKIMSKLQAKNGNILSSQNEILEETMKHYKTLYTEREVNDINLNDTIHEHPSIHKLTDIEQLDLESNLSYEEMLNSLKRMSNNSSPGNSGFTPAFYKFFWCDIGHFLVRSINEAFEVGELSPTLKQGVITCIPKGNKDKLLLKNWRPISLLNVSYKIASGAIAGRLKPILGKLINEDQTGFLSGRYIGENIRLIYDTMFYTEKQNCPGMLLLLDFATAFDSLAWKFMFNVLHFFNFGENIIKWIKLFYTNIVSCVTINGHLSEWFNICRGVRQGDPLSPYLFILCAEILAILFRQNENIKGIMINNIEFLVSQYADDTTLLLDGTERSLRNTISVLKFYANISGLQINIDKTKAIWIGAYRNRQDSICQDLGINFEFDDFNLLGVKFSRHLEDIADDNFVVKIEEIRLLLNTWSKRIITPIGKITVIKSLALAKLNHLIISLPNPSINIVKRIQKMFFNFLWNNGPDKIKRVTITQNYDKGGLRMVDLSNFITALKNNWLKKVISKQTKYLVLVNAICPIIASFHTFGSEYVKNKLPNITNPFWKNVFESYLLLYPKFTVKDWDCFKSLPLWHNSYFKIAGQSCFLKHFYDKGIILVNDLTNKNGEFLTFDIIVNTLNIQTNFLQYNGLINTIRGSMRSLNIVNTGNIETIRPIQPLPVQFFNSYNKGCRIAYDLLISNNILPKSQNKWETTLNIAQPNWNSIYRNPFISCKDSNLHWLQFRINHRILGTNHLLFKMDIVNDCRCSFCEENNETIYHLLWECIYVVSFIRDLKTLINNITNNSIQDITAAKFLLLVGCKPGTLSIIFMLAKLHIYSSKMNNSKPSINIFKVVLKHWLYSERYRAKSTNNIHRFNVDWGNYYTFFEDPQNQPNLE